MIIDIPKHLISKFSDAWRSSTQKDIHLDHLDDVTFTSEGYILSSSKFKPTKDKAPKSLFTLKITEDTFVPVQVGAFDLRLELTMLSTSILNDLENKAYARQLYALYNPNFEPISLTFPELRFLWNYIRAYVSILYAREGNDFDINSIKESFLAGLLPLELAKSDEFNNYGIPMPQESLNNYQTWYDSSMYGIRWHDFVDE